MRVLGIEFAGSNMNYVLLEKTHDGFNLLQSNCLAVGETRSRDALIAFQSAVKTTFNATAPTLIAIKEKPEKGGMQAGSAALKMEGVVLANAPCPVEFVSGSRINKCDRTASIHKYLQPAFKAAAVLLGTP
jgi:hypothetical protein